MKTIVTAYTTRPALRRALALGAAAAILAAVGVVELGAPAEAEETPVAGLALPVPVTDVTETDTDLGSVAREVVVSFKAQDGTPQVRKLRARTQDEADQLAEELNAEPGVVAQVNRVVEVAPIPSSVAGGTVGKPDRAVPVRSERQVRAHSVAPLGAEQYGGHQWGLTAVGAESAWQITRGTGVTVAVVDSGVDATHPDLAGQVLPQIDFVDDPWTGDPTGHGTHVAGIIAASLDGAGVAGLANQVRVLPIRVLGADGTGDTYTEVAGIIEAVNAGAQVINLSLGGPFDSLEAEAVQYATGRGVTVIAAVGNEYETGNPVNYPAAYDGVIGVSSVNPAGGSSLFANSGSYVDISAPGEGILSTVPGGGWEYKQGTSMAAPFVSAAAALVRVANPTLSKAQVDDILLSTARDDAEGDGPDNWFGHGILQADRAVMNAATLPGGIRATPTVTQSALPATVKVKAVSGRSKLKVDVNPDKGTGYWTFQVQRRNADGSWKALKSYRTQGARETRTLNLPKGTYRVVVRAKYGFAETPSAAVYLKR
jgi:subtilisin family serine protease